MNGYMFPDEKEKVNLPPQTAFMMKEAASWGRVLAIINFAAIGLMLLFGMVMIFAAALDGVRGHGMGLIMLFFSFFIIGAVCFFPAFFLYRASVNMRKALADNDTATLNSAFDSLKNYFLFNVILGGISLILGLFSMFGVFIGICM